MNQIVNFPQQKVEFLNRIYQFSRREHITKRCKFTLVDA